METLLKSEPLKKFADLGKYCSFEQAIYSATAQALGLTNMPTQADYARMKYQYDHMIVPVFDHFGPGRINSFFRSGVLQPLPHDPKRLVSVNGVVGGAANSNHIRGMATDIDYDLVPGVTNVEVFDWIRTNKPFWELISENPDRKTNNPLWVHVATNAESPARNLVKRMYYDTKGNKQYQFWPWHW